LLRYQLVQYELERFELKLVTTGEEAYKNIVGHVSPEMQSLLGPAAVIEIRRYEDLLPDRSGKFRPVISKCVRRVNS
jgi:hypothetical protein